MAAAQITTTQGSATSPPMLMVAYSQALRRVAAKSTRAMTASLRYPIREGRLLRQPGAVASFSATSCPGECSTTMPQG